MGDIGRNVQTGKENLAETATVQTLGLGAGSTVEHATQPGRNQHSKPEELPQEPSEEVKADTIRLDQPPPHRERNSSYGTSSDAGLRPLDKAAEKGDEKAASLRKQVLDNQIRVNAACIGMGWRSETGRVPHTGASLHR